MGSFHQGGTFSKRMSNTMPVDVSVSSSNLTLWVAEFNVCFAKGRHGSDHHPHQCRF